MKKLFKRVMILGIVSAVLYGGYFFLVKPNGYTDRSKLVNDFVNSMDVSGSCDEYFNSETVDLCEEFIDELDGKDVVFDSGVMRTGKLEATFLIDDTEVDFVVVFEAYEPSGLRSYFDDYYYKIDYIY